MKLQQLVGTALAATLLGGSARAAVITFDDVDSNAIVPTLLASYQSQGMTFYSPQGSTSGMIYLPPDPSACGHCTNDIDPIGSSAMGDPLDMRMQGGGTFDLLGFTFGTRPISLGNAPATGYIPVQFWYDDGRLETENFEVHEFGPEAVSITRSGLRRVRWLRGLIDYDQSTCSFCIHSGASIGPFMIDNIVVANLVASENPTDPEVPPETAIPEPKAWAMMILGFTAVGALWRRRNRQGVVRPSA